MGEKAAQGSGPYMINSIIGLLIMFSGFFLPEPSILVEPAEKYLALNLPQADGGLLLSVTRLGVMSSMFFFGMIYLWSTVDLVWPSLFGASMLIFGGYSTAPKVLNQFMGNPMVAMAFFVIMLAGAIVYCGLASWVVRYLLTRDFLDRRPWALTTTFLFATYIVAIFGQVGACLLMWAILFEIFRAVGFKKGDLYVKCMTCYVCLCILLMFATDAIKGGSFLLLTNLWNLSVNDPTLQAAAIGIGPYLAFSAIISVTSITLLVLFMRFVLRVDVTPLKKFDRSILLDEGLPKLTFAQKVALLDLVGYAAWMLLPSIIGTDNAIGAFAQKNSLAGGLLAMTALFMVFKNGKPLFNIGEVNQKYAWGVFIMFAAALLVGGVMVGKGTNVPVFLAACLHKWLHGLNFFTLSIVVVAMAMFATNFLNSIAFGILLTPVLVSMCASFAIPSAPLMACFIFSVLIAGCLPSGSVYAALLFGNTEWVDKSDLIMHSAIGSLIILMVLIVLGLPLANVFF